MIRLENVTLLTTKGESNPINFVAEDKVNYLNENEKGLFKVLSIKQQYIKDGVMSIDDFSLFPLKDQRKYAFVLNINSAVVALDAVFVFNLSFKDKSRQLLKQDLITLRELSLKEDEEKINKVDAIFELLKKHHVSYVLIDGNNEINKKNRLLINESLDKLENLCVLFLNQTVTLKDAVVQESFALEDERPDDDGLVIDDKTNLNEPSEKDEIKEAEQIDEVSEDDLHDLEKLDGKQDDNLNDETDLIAIDDEKELKSVDYSSGFTKEEEDFKPYEKEFRKFDLQLAYEQGENIIQQDIKDHGKLSFKNKILNNKFMIYLKEMFKNLYLYYLFNALFSIFLGVCSFSSIYLVRNNNGLIAGVLIFLDIIFVIMHFYIIGSTYAGIESKLKTINQKIGFSCLFVLFSIVGFLLGLGFVALLSHNKVFVDMSQYNFTDYLLGLIVGIINVAVPLAAKPVGWLYLKVRSLIIKFFPEKTNE